MISETRFQSNMALHAAWSPPVGIRFLAVGRDDCQRPVRYLSETWFTNLPRVPNTIMRGSPRNSE